MEAQEYHLPLPPRENREFDVIIFGASGYTGKWTTEHMAVCAKSDGIQWAVAGRNAVLLREALATATKHTGIDVTDIPIIIADINDAHSMKVMCQRTRLLLNFVGPYILHGETTVKCCIDNQTDHVDVSGERFYTDHVQLKYDKAAQSAGVYVLPAAGINSVFAETGLHFLNENFDGDIDTVDAVMQFDRSGEKDTAHYGTFLSFIHQQQMHCENMKEQKQLFAKGLPKPVRQDRRKVFLSKEAGGWCSLFEFMDTTSRNTDYYNYHHRNMRPMNSMMYVMHPSYFEALGVLVMTNYIAWSILQFSWGRKFFERYHNALSGGAVSKNGVTPEMAETMGATLTMTASGYSCKARYLEEQHHGQPDKRLVITIKTKNSLKATAITAIETSLCILREREKLPSRGGVLPIGAALLDTTIIKRLKNSGIVFEVRPDL